VRGDSAVLPRLPTLGAPVEVIGPGAPVPDGAKAIAGDTLAGVRIDGETTRQRAEWAVMQTCRRPFDGPGDRHVIRPISLRISRLLTRLPVTPNHVTLLSMVIGAAACLLVTRGSRGASPPAACA